MKRLSFVRHAGFAVLALFGLIAVSASTANAQYNDPYYQQRNYGYYGNQQSSQIAINNGYQLGYGTGSNDRAFGRRYNLNDDKSYRDADSGYSNSGFRSKDQYRQLFRQGFELGYRDGYSGQQRQGYYNPRNDGYYNNNNGGYYNNNNGGYYNNDGYYNDNRYYNRQRRRARQRVYIVPRY